MAAPLGLDEPGTYVVTNGDEKTTIEADSFDYDGPDGSLRAWKGGRVVGTWRWWGSIVRKDT